MRLVSCLITSLACLSAQIALAANSQSLHLDWLDNHQRPEKNFFAYANGNWQKTHPIPADHAQWDTFAVLQKQNDQLIKEIIESNAQQLNKPPGSIQQKIGDLYLSGMNEALIEKTGAQPLAPEFALIAACKDVSGLPALLAHLHMRGVDALFDLGQMQDFRDSRQVIAVTSQSGLGLPDRDYYLEQTPKMRDIRQAYLSHITHMLMLLGDEKSLAQQQAQTILRIETLLAKASMSRIAQRDPRAIYHMQPVSELQKAMPNFSWTTYLAELGRPDIQQVNVANPGFFVAINKALTSITMADWRTYLRWHVLDAYSSYLSDAFVQEDFRMASAMTATKKLLPRWRRVVMVENGVLGFAIGKLYVEKTFSPQAKLLAQEILENIRGALERDLSQLTWMSAETRQAALQKLAKLDTRIGYPDKWRDYTALTIDRGPYVLNIMRANLFLARYELNKIGKPVDESEWDMTPQTVNAYYDASQNTINIPAGILQLPYFSPALPAAMNYGAMGFIMGHEMTHAFDDEGAQFDGDGNLKNWWTESDNKKFHQATDCIATQYSTYTVPGNVHVKGKLVVGEATADLGGLMLAYHAYHATDAFKHAEKIAGFTPDQQFFLGAAHVWAGHTRAEAAARLVITDPHPPGIHRVNGVLANMSQFEQAFAVAPGSPMIAKQRCIIW